MRTLLFICEHNSARSQMAEAYLNALADGKFRAESAGLEPGVLNPYVVEVMGEDGLDISTHSTKSVFDLYRQQRQYDAVITVCSPEVGGKCPLFPGRVKRWNWPFADPSRLTGSREEILSATRIIRDDIKAKIQEFLTKFDQIGIRLFLEE